MRILGLIPARGGSKGVECKNKKLLGRKPLIQYSIETALQVEALSKIVVSTDDDEIAEIAQALGADVPGLRPAELATDRSPTIDTMVYVLRQLHELGHIFDAICLLQPTCPFRSSVDILNAIAIFDREDCDSVISVSCIPKKYSPYWAFEERQNGLLSSILDQNKIIPRRQDLPTTYYRNGVIYLTKVSTVLDDHSIFGEKIGYYVMPSEDSINIDTIQDWVEAERHLNEKR